MTEKKDKIVLVTGGIGIGTGGGVTAAVLRLIADDYDVQVVDSLDIEGTTGDGASIIVYEYNELMKKVAVPIEQPTNRSYGPVKRRGKGKVNKY